MKFIFDPFEGIGFSAMKTPIGSTDFMSAGPWYSYDDVNKTSYFIIYLSKLKKKY